MSNQVSRSSLATDFTQGYGTFCFRGSVTFGLEYLEYYGYKVPEKLRAGTFPSQPPLFPFMKLPVEVRHRIYKIVLASLLENRRSSKFKKDFPGVMIKDGFRFTVADGVYNSSMSDVDYGYDVNPILSEEQSCNHLEIYKSIQNGTIVDSDIPSGWIKSADVSGELVDESECAAEEDSVEGSSYEDSDTQSECSAEAGSVEGSSYEDSDKQSDSKFDLQTVRSSWRPPRCVIRILHFGIGILECLYADCMEDDDCPCDSFHDQTHDTLHRLSKVSRQMTEDLGEFLWKHAVVDIVDLEVFLVFFRERPRIWQHVKVLTLCVTHTLGEQTPTPLLSKVSEFASQHLNLQVLTVHFRIGCCTVGELPRPKVLEEWAPLFRSMKVWKKFIVHVPDRFGIYIGEDQTHLIIEKVTGMWLPNSLRQTTMAHRYDAWSR